MFLTLKIIFSFFFLSSWKQKWMKLQCAWSEHSSTKTNSLWKNRAKDKTHRCMKVERKWKRTADRQARNENEILYWAFNTKKKAIKIKLNKCMYQMGNKTNTSKWTSNSYSHEPRKCTKNTSKAKNTSTSYRTDAALIKNRMTTLCVNWGSCSQFIMISIRKCTSQHSDYKKKKK